MGELKGESSLSGSVLSTQSLNFRSTTLFKEVVKTLKSKVLFGELLKTKSTSSNTFSISKLRTNLGMKRKFKLGCKKVISRNRTKLFKVRRNTRFKFLLKQNTNLSITRLF